MVGQDGGGTEGFVWNEGTQSYNPISGLTIALGISSNSQLVAGEDQNGNAAVYTRTGTAAGAYWGGEATFVNRSGTVVGDTSSAWRDGDTSPGGQAMAEIDGQSIDLTNAYAPAGVSFNYCAGLNDAGQILVWSNGSFYANSAAVASYVLTPALPGDANLDGRVDINDLTVVLAHFGQTAGVAWSTGDFIGDGQVDINDLTILLSHFGQSDGASPAATAAVPEPRSVALLVAWVSAVLLAGMRKRPILTTCKW